MIGRMATLSRRGNGDGHVVGDSCRPVVQPPAPPGLPFLGKSFTSECKVFARTFSKIYFFIGYLRM
jgi:hypothetical protein